MASKSQSVPIVRYVRTELDYPTFLKTIVAPATEKSKGVILDVERKSTARESSLTFQKAVLQQPDAIIRMGGVGMKIDGRSSLFDLWKLPGAMEQYAVDVKDDAFVAKLSVM